MLKFIDISEVHTASIIRALMMEAVLTSGLSSLVEVDGHFRGAYFNHDGGSMHLLNVSLLQQNYVALYPRRLSFSCSPLRT
jgi:hypothetical protein